MVLIFEPYLISRRPGGRVESMCVLRINWNISLGSSA